MIVKMNMFKILLFITLIQNNFISGIVKDFSRNSQFLVVNVNYKNKPEYAVIENDNLFLFFAIKNSVTQKEYPKYMADFLYKNQSIKVSEKEIKRYDFHIVASNPVYNKNEILKIFFNSNGVIKKEVSERKMFDIIFNLFRFNISCHIDDETGLLVITNL